MEPKEALKGGREDVDNQERENNRKNQSTFRNESTQLTLTAVKKHAELKNRNEIYVLYTNADGISNKMDELKIRLQKNNQKLLEFLKLNQIIK